MRSRDAKKLLEKERERLLELRERTAASLEQRQEDRNADAQHPADYGSEVHDRGVDQAVLESLELDLSEVDAALRRVDDGEYGQCEHCGERIPDERLEAVPTARYCVGHQPAEQT